MTRSEERIDAIEREIAHECACATSKKLTGKDEESERHVKRMGLLREVKDILLAEQKRSEGCEYCNGNMLDGYALENMYGESHRIINLSMKNHRSGDQLPISFCPNCGRDLTEGERA